MEQKANNLFDGKMDNIRDSLEKITIKSDLRRQLIGGISEEDVTNYISTVWQQFRFLETDLLSKIEKLQSAKDLLGKEFAGYREKSEKEMSNIKEELNQALAEANNEINIHMDRIAELEKENLTLRNEMESHKQVEEELRAKAIEAAHDIETSEMLEAKIKELEKQLAESNKIAEEYCAACKEMEEQVKSGNENITQLLEEKVNLSSRVISFKDELSSIYKQLNHLDEQININDDLQQQLEQERLRADKAEHDASQFLSYISDLKERFQKNQGQLEVHFAEIEEKRKAIESDVNSLHTNLANFCRQTDIEINGFYESMRNK